MDIEAALSAAAKKKMLQEYGVCGCDDVRFDRDGSIVITAKLEGVKNEFVKTLDGLMFRTVLSTWGGTFKVICDDAATEREKALVVFMQEKIDRLGERLSYPDQYIPE